MTPMMSDKITVHLSKIMVLPFKKKHDIIVHRSFFFFLSNNIAHGKSDNLNGIMLVTLFSNSLFRQPINVLFKIKMAPHYKI